MTRAREAARLIGNSTFRLDSNNAVGFNSTTPDAMFDINHGLTVAGVSTFTGNVIMSGDLTVQGTTTTLDTIVQEVDLMNIQANSSTPGLGVTQSGSGAIIAAYDGASEVFRIADGGSVGIGTASPSNRLHIADTTTNTKLLISSAYEAALELQNGGGSEVNVINSAGSNNLSFRVSNSEKMRMDSSGRLLVGTSSSTWPYKIVVEGGIGFSAGSLAITRSQAGSSIGSGGDIGYLTFGGNDNTAFAQISAWADATPGASDYPGRLVFATTADGASSPTERLRIDSSGRLLLNGGTDVRMELGTTGTTGTNDRNHIRADGSSLKYNTCSGGVHIFEQNGTERLRIDSSGQFGIGLSSGIDAALHVFKSGDGQTPVRFQTSNSNGNLRFYNDSVGWSIDSEGDLRFTTSRTGSGQPERMRIDSSGNVGIGILNPGDYHPNANDLVMNGGMTLANTSQGSIYFADSATGTGEYVGQLNYDHTTDSMAFVINNGERLRLASAGQIGLGGANYGTSGQVITSNGSGSAPTWQDAGGGAWNLITTVTASGASQADITGTSSTYSKYCIIGRNIRGTATDWFYGRWFDNGTLMSGNDYNVAWYTIVSNSPTTMSSNNETNYFRPTRIGNGTNDRSDFILWFNATHEDSTSTFNFQFSGQSSVGSVSRFQNGGGAVNTSFTNISGVRFYPSSGTITGTFDLYGIS
jgi:hypothetical protein